MAARIVPMMRVRKSLVIVINMIVSPRLNPQKIKRLFRGNLNNCPIKCESPNNPMGRKETTLEALNMVSKIKLLSPTFLTLASGSRREMKYTMIEKHQELTMAVTT